MANPPNHSPTVRRHAALAVWVVNLAFGVVIGGNWLAHVPDVDSIKVWLFALPALVSTVLFLTLIPGLGFLFLPFTTLGYTWAINTYGTISGGQAVVVVIALLLDLGVFGGGAAQRRRRS